MLNKKCYSINSFRQIEELILIRNNKKKILVIFIKNYLIKGFGIDWLRTLIKIVSKKYSNHNIKFFVDTGHDYGLSILILKENIDFIKLQSNKIILNKINQIAKKNKVLLNPNFNIIDLTKIKKLKKINI